MTRSGSDARLTAAEEAFLRDFTRQFADDVRPSIFMETAMYPRDGWNQAKQWAEHWLTQLRDKTPLSPPERVDGKFRDVLNATWLCRLLYKGDFDQIEKSLANLGKSLCETIINAGPTGRTRFSTSATLRHDAHGRTAA